MVESQDRIMLKIISVLVCIINEYFFQENEWASVANAYIFLYNTILVIGQQFYGHLEPKQFNGNSISSILENSIQSVFNMQISITNVFFTSHKLYLYFHLEMIWSYHSLKIYVIRILALWKMGL